MDYQRFLSRTAQKRKADGLRLKAAQLVTAGPGMISLGGGYPYPDLFPFTEAEFTLEDGTQLCLSEQDMKKAQQYGQTGGEAPLIELLRGMQREFHDPPTASRSPAHGGLDLTITAGGQEAIAKTIEMLVSAGDNVIIHIPAYSGLLSALQPTDCNLLTVETDKDGIDPDNLRDLMSRWKPADALNPESDIPRFLFTIPSGCNPTGATLTYERKKEIYQIAQLYNMLIVEDDAYFFLQYEQMIPSFLSLDTDGRVIRLDTFSKFLSPGLRLGFISGPSPLIEKIKLQAMTSSMFPCKIAQTITFQLLEKWGMPGVRERISRLQSFYRKQRNAMSASLTKWLKDWCEWEEPSAGMFFWIKLNGLRDTRDMIENKAFQKEVLLVHGSVFYPGGNNDTDYFRASFSYASPVDIDKGFERLSIAIREEMKNQK